MLYQLSYPSTVKKTKNLCLVDIIYIFNRILNGLVGTKYRNMSRALGITLGRKKLCLKRQVFQLASFFSGQHPR